MRHITLRLMACVISLAALAATANAPISAAGPVPANYLPITTFPLSLPANCEIEKPILFNPCIDQMVILSDARKAAAAQGKTVLVDYGADWCIWCHVFESYARGNYGKFIHPLDGKTIKMAEQKTPVMASEASELNRYFAENFVIAHVSASAADGDKTLIETGAKPHDTGSIPFIYALDAKGKFSGFIKSNEVETRKDTGRIFRGYDRQKLLLALKALRAESQK